MQNTLPVELFGYLRGFKGHTERWNGAVATLYSSGNPSDSVLGTVVKMTPEQVAILDTYEGHPTFYKRTDLKVTAYDLDDATGYYTRPFELDSVGYIMLDEVSNTFEDVSEAYKIACCKTVYTHKKMRGLQHDRDCVLQINNAVTKQFVYEFRYEFDD